jgi:putative phosphoribosyl transferase
MATGTGHGRDRGDVEDPVDGLIRELEISREDVDELIAQEQAEMKRREELYRGGKPALDLRGRTAILVDDGLATGSTMLAAVRYARTLAPATVIVGVPVGSEEACDCLRKEADDFVCLATPELFFGVGAWYRDFQHVSDTEVQHLPAESHYRLRARVASSTAA